MTGDGRLLRRRLPAPPRALRARRAPAPARHADDQPRRGPRLPLQPGARRGAAAELRHAGVQPHRRDHAALPPRGAGGGDAALPAADVALLRRWTTRLLLGNWTHAGYLNWDTGYGLHRLHSGQYWAWSMQGLLTIATAKEFAARPEHPRWAKALFDRGLRLYARWADEAGEPLAPQLPFDMVSDHRDHDLYASRMAANAVRAIRLGLGARGPTTRRPSTPTTASSSASPSRRRGTRRRSSPARTTPSGTAASSSPGCSARAAPSRPPRAASRPPRSASWSATRPIASCSPRSPAGRATRACAWSTGARRSGSFKALTAIGEIRAGRVRVTTTHTFRPASIDERWDVRCPRGCAGYDVDVLLPTWGETATATAHTASGGARRSRARARRPSRSRASAGSSWARRRSRATPSPRCGRDAARCSSRPPRRGRSARSRTRGPASPSASSRTAG